MTTATLEFDHPWKNIVERHFQDFTKFFFPRLARQINWQVPVEFLDQELSKVVRRAVNKSRRVDKLVKVWLLDGHEAILYIHLEIQSQRDSGFAKRVFIYHYRLYDRYGPCVTSLAILGDDSPDWRPKRYQYQTPGSQMSFRFTTVKLWDYRNQLERLQKSRNPFAQVVRIHLMSLQTRHATVPRLEGKKALLQALYEANFSEQQFFDLYVFLDWVLTLPEELEQQFNDFAVTCEETKKMPFITGIERQGIQKGILQKSREDLIEVLTARFQRVPDTLRAKIEAMEDVSLLSTLHREAVVIDSLASFTRRLRQPRSNTTATQTTKPGSRR